MSDQATRPLTFGEKAAGFTYESDSNPLINAIRQKSADYIDALNEARTATENGEIKRQLSVAITEAQTSTKWAIDAINWKH